MTPSPPSFPNTPPRQQTLSRHPRFVPNPVLFLNLPYARDLFPVSTTTAPFLPHCLVTCLPNRTSFFVFHPPPYAPACSRHSLSNPTAICCLHAHGIHYPTPPLYVACMLTAHYPTPPLYVACMLTAHYPTPPLYAACMLTAHYLLNRSLQPRQHLTTFALDRLLCFPPTPTTPTRHMFSFREHVI